LDRLLYLSALHFLDKHLVLFYQGGYFRDQLAVDLVRSTILELCAELKDDSIALVDAIAPPDYVLNSILGESNGLVYQNLYNSMVQSNGAFDKIGDLNAFMVKTEFASLKSKL
jgi:acyl-CoA oxidase